MSAKRTDEAARHQGIQRLLNMGDAVYSFGGVLGSVCNASREKAMWLLGEAAAALPVIEPAGPEHVFLLVMSVDNVAFTASYRRVLCSEIQAVSSMPIELMKGSMGTFGGHGCLAVYQEGKFVHSEVLEVVVKQQPSPERN